MQTELAQEDSNKSGEADRGASTAALRFGFPQCREEEGGMDTSRAAEHKTGSTGQAGERQRTHAAAEVHAGLHL